MKTVAVNIYGGSHASAVLQDNDGKFWSGTAKLGLQKMKPTAPLESDSAAAKVVALLRSGGRTEIPAIQEAFDDGKPGALARVSRAVEELA